MPLEPRRFAIQTLLQFCGLTCEECSNSCTAPNARNRRLEDDQRHGLRSAAATSSVISPIRWMRGIGPSQAPRALADELHSLEVIHRRHSVAFQLIPATSAAMIHVWDPVAEPTVRRG
jgi:hypothetical protein